MDQYSFLLKARVGEHLESFLIAYTDYPAGSMKMFDPNDFLEKTWQGGFGKWDGKLIFKRRISLGAFAGIDSQLTGTHGSPLLINDRHYLVNDRLYMLTAIMREDQVKAGDAAKFLDSFRLLK